VIVYLDTSTVLPVLFRQGRRLAEWDRWDDAYTSELLATEARRAIDRLPRQTTAARALGLATAGT
jgi:hypothetical protein